jgi:hypothetical protein
MEGGAASNMVVDGTICDCWWGYSSDVGVSWRRHCAVLRHPIEKALGHGVCR